MTPVIYDNPIYLYTYACHEDEQQLCELELRTLFGFTPNGSLIASPLNLDPSRSPFIKQKVSVEYISDSLEQLGTQVQQLQLGGATFKVLYIDHDSAPADYDERRLIERQIGMHIRGKADMRNPERVFGIVNLDGRWLFGDWRKNEAVWLANNKKPQNYSTALSTRVARAIVNITAPNPTGMKVIDPCCGMGTVLIEALSMGVDIVGTDSNPLAVQGARLNLAHFGYPDVVSLGDMREVTEWFDAAIIDMPYNLCSKLPEDAQLSMLASACGFAARAVIITTEPIDTLIERAGFRIEDRCEVRKGIFARQIALCAAGLK